MAYDTRLQKVKQQKWLQLSTYDTNIKHTYFIKNVRYGAYIESYDYNKVQVAFKSQRVSYEKNLTGEKANFSIQRAREKVYQICEANRGRHGNYREIFFTLTTQDQLTEYKESNKKIKSFIRRLSKHVGHAVKYIIIPELHKSGAIHYHGIFYNLPFIDIKIFRYQLWKEGYVDLQVPRKIRSTSAYIAKYMTKDYQKNTPLHTKLYFTARDMYRPETEFTTEKPVGILKVKDIKIHKNYQKIKYLDICIKNLYSSKR